MYLRGGWNHITKMHLQNNRINSKLPYFHNKIGLKPFFRRSLLFLSTFFVLFCFFVKQVFFRNLVVQ